MKLKYLLLISLLSEPAWTAELVLSKGEDSAEFQESTFIKLLAAQSHGEIPYPFSKLVEKISPNGHSHVFIPNGRSLVKNHADYAKPRIVVSPTFIRNAPVMFGDNITPKEHQRINKLNLGMGDLFIGHVPGHNAIEVISYNQKKKKFDFFIVQDYEEGKKPKIVHDPAQCLSCHQNEAPLFSQFPWSEMTGQNGKSPDMDSSKNKVMDLIKAKNKNRKDIDGFSINEVNSLTQVGFLDGDVRESNKTLFRNRVCETLCPTGSSPQCKQDLILSTLGSDKRHNLKHFSKFEDALAKLDHKSSVIPNRDPFTGKSFKTIEVNSPVKDIAELGPEASIDLTFTDPGFFTHVAEEATDSKFGDPTTPRPQEIELLFLKKDVKNAKSLNEKITIAAKICLDILNDDEGFSTQKRVSAKDITPELLSKKEVADELHKNWPDTRNLFHVLSKTIEAKVKQDEDCEEIGVKPVIPVYKYSDLLNVANKLADEKIEKPKHLFQKYCMQCHASDKFIPLPLDSMEKLSNYIPTFSDTGIPVRLEKNVMPPAFAPQPSDDERKLMLESVRALQKK